MRRFTLWTILLLTLGILLAGGGYWAYWNAYARFQPVTVTANQAEVETLLNRSSWLSEGGGSRPVWFVGWRDGAVNDRYQSEEFPRLRAAGLEPRVVVFARPDREGAPQSTAAERATVATLWLTRDWGLFQRWMATPVRNWTADGLPPADGDLARTAVVGAGRDMAEELRRLLEPSDVPDGWPLVIWRDEQGFLKACACSSRRAWPFVRDDLGAPDRASAPTPAAPTEAPPAAPDSSPQGSPLAYPEVAPLAPGQPAPLPPVTGQPLPPAQGAFRPSAPRSQSQSQPSARPQPRTPPRPAPESGQADPSEDTVFY